MMTENSMAAPEGARGITRRRRVQANRIKSEAFRNGEDADRTIRVFSKTVADTMKEIHGGTWSIRIDHQSQAVFICQDAPASDRIQPSQLRELV